MILRVFLKMDALISVILKDGYMILRVFLERDGIYDTPVFLKGWMYDTPVF